MKSKTVEKMLCIECSTGIEFEQQFNDAAAKLSGTDYEKIWNLNKGHCCYFVYKETELSPETDEDEFILRGEQKLCGDCPYFVFADKLSGTCTHSKVKIKTRTGTMLANGKACPILYKGLKEGVMLTDESWRME